MEDRIRNLFRKYLTNTCTKAEFDEVFHYLQTQGEDPIIRQQLRLIYEEEMASLPSDTFVGADGALEGTVSEAITVSGAVEAPRRRRRPAALLWIALFATISGASVWWLQRRHGTAAGNAAIAQMQLVKKATQRSEYKYMLLPDSTQVWLNAASTLEFPQQFDAGERKVTLTGEAFFDVKNADKTPFIIYTGNVSTEVLGTAFNIKAYPGLEKITVAVKRGKVKVNYADKPVALLTMGQQVSISNLDNSIKQKKVFSETAQWQNGDLMYDDYTIGDIVADLERVYNVGIIVKEPSVNTMRVSTGFKKSDGVEKALEVLGELTDTQLTRENGRYIMK